MAKPLKSKLEQHVAAKLRIKSEPGYFDGPKFVHGTIYRVYLGCAVSTPDQPGYIEAAAAYQTHHQAKAAGEWIKAKCHEWLSEGHYQDDSNE
jgi:hypothetical protein